MAVKATLAMKRAMARLAKRVMVQAERNRWEKAREERKEAELALKREIRAKLDREINNLEEELHPTFRVRRAGEQSQ